MHDSTEQRSTRALQFGNFLLYPQRRLLFQGDRPLHITSRAMDILLLLVEQPGMIIRKEVIIAQVWKGAVVEEINLRVHISALRRALGECRTGERYIANVPLRGYGFVGIVEPIEAPSPWLVPLAGMPRHNLPPSLRPVEGRADFIRCLIAQSSAARMLTVTGPGGVGKTSVALRVAERLRDRFRDGVWFVDLSSEADPARVSVRIGLAMGIRLQPANAVQALAQQLSGRQLLLVLDNCEHLIGACASVSESLLRSLPGLKVLSTSREPLQVEGEHVHRLGPLEIPSAAACLAEERPSCTAVDLFAKRAAEVRPTFELMPHQAPLIADICRQLDGIPMAIEIAARQLETLGLADLRSCLAGRFALTMKGRRTAPARHQSLKACFDWSFGLLSPHEQGCLATLAGQADSFTLETAHRCLRQAEADCPDPIELLQALAAKSLLYVTPSGNRIVYRMGGMTRAYAISRAAGLNRRSAKMPLP
jgi:predicted ATPase/DNA-binding winged helix-turn-helix (wHTH) protein